MRRRSTWLILLGVISAFAGLLLDYSDKPFLGQSWGRGLLVVVAVVSITAALIMDRLQYHRDVEKVAKDRIEACLNDSLDGFLCIITSDIVPFYPGTRSSLYLVTSSTNEMSFTNGWGTFRPEEKSYRYKKMQPMVGRAWSTKKPCFTDWSDLSNAELEGHYSLPPTLVKALKKLGSSLAVPVFINGTNRQLVGICLIDSPQPLSNSRLNEAAIIDKVSSATEMMGVVLSSRESES